MARYVARRTEPFTVLLVVLTALVLPLCAVAQRPVHVPRIAFLGLGSPPAPSQSTPFLKAFRHGLRERGWVEGHNLTIEWRWAEGNLDRFAALVTEVIGLHVEVMVVSNRATASIAHKATTTIPIVVVSGGGLLESGLITSLARPGGNVTGVHNRNWELTAKRLELLKQAVSGVTRVAVLGGVSWVGLPPGLQEDARSLEMELHVFQARETSEFDSAFAAMTSAHAHALLVFGDSFFASHLAQIAALAAQHQLPSICETRSYVAAGCLMSYGFSTADLGQRSAAYVDKILRGAKPADLPVEQPMKFELAINLKTAKALGLTMPPSLLFQADEVIQ